MTRRSLWRRAVAGVASVRTGLRSGVLAGLFVAVLPLAAVAADPSVQHGEYLARAGDCISCHTRPGGLPFAGGLAMQTPFGTIISTNITPDAARGIGGYTQADFTRALRQGRAQDGHYLYPAMPYNHFAKLSDSDLQDLYVYFMQGVKPAVQDNATTQLAWPFRMRWLMSLWNLLYLKDARFEPVPAQTAEWNRGAYLVQGLGHCSACHTPRSFTGGEKASSEADGDAFLAGSTIDGWYAQPLRQLEGAAPPGLGTWSRPELVDYLKTGRNARTAAFGGMVEVVGNSTQYLSREDLGAIAVYLKSLGGGAQEGVARAVDSSDPTSLALRAGDAAFLAAQPGALVYLNNCAACHRSDGQGARSTFPSLAGSSSVAATDPTSLIRVVLQGSAMPHTVEAPSELGMPALGWRLGDDKVAEVLSFVRRSWGNHAEPVTAKMVAKVRAALPADAPAQTSKPKY